MFFIAASPLVKIFLPEWHDRLQEKPDLIYDMETPFEFIVPRGTSGVKVKFNTPQQLPPSLARDQKELVSLYNWLTGGPSGTDTQETDPYGVVVFDPQLDMVSTYDEMNLLSQVSSEDPAKAKAAMKKQDDLRKQAAAKMRETRDRVKVMSEARIKRCMKMTHNNLLRQWQINEEMKLGKYPPSIAEMVGAYALAKEIREAEARGEALKSKMNDIMRNQVV